MNLPLIISTTKSKRLLLVATFAEIPRGATNGYDVIVVYVQVKDKFGNDPIVSSSFISRYVIVTMWSQVRTIVGEMGGNI